MMADSQGRHFQPDAMEAVCKKLASLPPYADVKVALQRLQENGWRLATLTNSSEHSQEQQLKNAGLTNYFEQKLSVDAVRRFKPALETYRYAADTLGVKQGNRI
jgi:2-haloacid dehalogenase